MSIADQHGCGQLNAMKIMWDHLGKIALFSQKTQTTTESKTRSKIVLTQLKDQVLTWGSQRILRSSFLQSRGIVNIVCDKHRHQQRQLSDSKRCHPMHIRSDQ